MAPAAQMVIPWMLDPLGIWAAMLEMFLWWLAAPVVVFLAVCALLSMLGPRK
jgi:hypothetical protein